MLALRTLYPIPCRNNLAKLILINNFVKSFVLIFNKNLIIIIAFLSTSCPIISLISL